MQILMDEMSAKANEMHTKRVEDAKKELDWVDNEVADGDMKRVGGLGRVGGDNLQTGRMLDWQKKVPMVDRTETETDIEMEVSLTAKQLETKYRLLRARGLKKEWLDKKGRNRTENGQRRKKELQKKMALLKKERFSKDLEEIACAPIETWWK